MKEYFGGLNFAGFRRMFYLATPKESSFDSLQSTPNIVNEAIPWFIILIFLEIVYSLYKGKRNYYRVNDAITSFSSGLLQLTIKVLFRSVEFTACCYVHDKFAFFDLPWDSTWTWIIAFLAVDFTYYWSHRAVHEVNFLWAFHQMHHSSEDYNLSTALRQHMIIQYTSVLFNIPQAILLPPQVHLVHTSLNLIYQFWIHTQIITRLGPLEYIINTPSHHRVHHGRNRYCIDKNYAGTLIIWDRLFGTFQAEKPEEPVVYGLVHNVNTFNQLYCQLSMPALYYGRIPNDTVSKNNYFQTTLVRRAAQLCVCAKTQPLDLFLFKHVLWDKMNEMKTLTDKLKAVLYGPGWFPDKPRLGNLDEIPEIENPVQIYDPKIPQWQNVYVCFHILLTFIAFFSFAGQREDLTLMACFPHVCLIALSFNCYGAFFDAKWYAPYMELFRCMMYSYFCPVQHWLFGNSMLISTFLWTSFILKRVKINSFVQKSL